MQCTYYKYTKQYFYTMLTAIKTDTSKTAKKNNVKDDIACITLTECQRPAE